MDILISCVIEKAPLDKIIEGFIIHHYIKSIRFLHITRIGHSMAIITTKVKIK